MVSFRSLWFLLPLEDVWEFDTKTQKWGAWETAGTPPRPRGSHSACVFGHEMLIFGGMDNSNVYVFTIISNWIIFKFRRFGYFKSEN